MLIDPGTNITGKKIKNEILWPMQSRTTVTNHELKDIIKVIKSLENRGIS